MSDSNLPINVSIRRSKEITERVPEDVTRAKAHAWLDVISPVTEWAGLKGDALRHKRELMRLEQEVSLSRLGEKLKERLEGEAITPITPKVLIPALEKASLENPDSEMIERWANLLAEEALNPSDDTRTCVSILSELGVNEAEILDGIQRRLAENDLWAEDKVEMRYATISTFLKEKYGDFQSNIKRHYDGELSIEELNAALGSLLDKAPVWIYSFRLSLSPSDSKEMSVMFNADQQVALDILEYRNLIRKQEYMELLGARPLLTIRWFDLTSLGIRFLKKVSRRQNSV
jgi:hypothetical protein